MVKLSDLEDFLKPDDVRDGDVVIILDEGVFKTAQETPFGRPAFQVPVKLPDGRVKTATINRTSRKSLASAYGDDTKEWSQRQSKVSKVKQNVQSVMRDVLYFYPVQAVLKPEQQERTPGYQVACQLCNAKIVGNTEEEAKERLRQHIAAGCK